MTEQTPTPQSSPGGASPGGAFVWHDLRTSNPEASKQFYSALFGWDIQTENITGQPYDMIRAGEAGIGGIEPLEAADTPSHWIGYVEVPDVDATVEAANTHGGASPVGGTDIPNVGRFAIISDPTGGTLAPFKSAHGPTPDPESITPGMFCWDELVTTDAEAANAFYNEVFPWKTAPMDMGPMGTYHLFKRGDDKDAGGMMQIPPDVENAHSSWIPYVLVESVDASTEKATGLGAQVCKAPTDIPGIGRFSVLMDPQGAVFAVYKSANPPS